jgi:hypothetical protein
MPSETTWVIAQDLIRVTFEDMDPIWLRTMWEDGGAACADMMEILISLALFKLKSRLWSVDLLWTMLMYPILGCIYFLDNGLLTSTLMTIYLVMDVVLYLWYYCVMFLLLSLNPIVLVKSSVVVFSLRRGKWFPGGCVSEGHDWDGTPWGQLLVNWYSHRAGHHSTDVPCHTMQLSCLYFICMSFYKSHWVNMFSTMFFSKWESSCAISTNYESCKICMFSRYTK